MKKCIFSLLLIIPFVSFSQYMYSFQKENFFGRLQNARAEAMGKSYTSIDGDLTCIYFNPAGMATMKGLEVNGSYTPPNFYSTNGYYYYYSAGYRINKYIQVGLSQFHFDFGKMNINDAIKYPFSERNTLSLSSAPIKNLYIGMNLNYYRTYFGLGKKYSSIMLDFGLIKKFQFLQKKNSSHSINLGASISNFTFSKILIDIYGNQDKDVLPVITRFGVNYQFNWDKHFLFDSLKTIGVLVQADYQKLLNSKYETAYRFGVELKLLEILSLRGGFYSENVYNYGYPQANRDHINVFTYGFGIQFPVYKLTKVPMNINFDFATMPQPSYTYDDYSNLKNFYTFNLRLNWYFKKKK